MLFPTAAFAVFFVGAFLANWLTRPRPRLWQATMIGFSFYFYGFWNPRYVMLLGASIVGNHLVARWIAADGRQGRAPLVIGVAGNLLVLGFFKYFGFFATEVTNTLGSLGLDVVAPVVHVVLPVGISFFTFQALSYLIDLHRGDLTGPMTLPELAFYLSFFPQLVAGPIVRATDMVDQIRRRPDPRTIPAGEGFLLITRGLAKKVVISSYLATNVVDPVFAVPSDHSRLEVLAAVYGYAIQIYADFSGYTDIAIGCALLLGFRFPANFDAPYRSLSVTEFWRRWHISLSTWLRDYLYIPIGGSRGSAARTARNLMVTMVLGGLWHGASWTFVGWGALHGSALVVERTAARYWRPVGAPAPLVTAARWLVTMNVICAAWVFFRAESFSRAFEIFGRLASAPIDPVVPGLVVVAITGAVMAQFVPVSTGQRLRAGFVRISPLAQVGVLAAALTVIDAFGPAGVAPFIYFQF
ncbi:MAG: MBOAT family O-acyltransferase [Acidimicrobiales bacterium]